MQEKMEWITGNDFRQMIIGAYQTFMREHEYINSLNVFPVPDGDTGTNMLLTLGSVARAVSEATDSDIGSLSKRAADSAIMGARGNSGVILSQIFRGIARGLSGKQQATSAEVGKAFQYGVLYAYRAVSKPVEGTILTVAKGIAKGTQQAVRDRLSFVEILTCAITAGEQELERTPELLPILKAAGVVDAGGKGLIVFLSGCLEGLGGEYSGPEANIDSHLQADFPNALEVDLVHPYCTEFLVKRASISTADVKKHLHNMGDSLVVAQGSDFLKVHIHTAHPGGILELATAWGTLHDIKIDNMADQHQHRQEMSITPEEEATGIVVISVAAGSGVAEIMNQMGAGIVIMGGQTMNPPVEDFVDAVHRGNGAQYIILPNNKNIILAAEQVKKLLGDRVEIVPTTNVPQGLAALVAFDAELDMATNIERMMSRLGDVTAAAVTTAVRDSMVDGRTVVSGKFIGVVDNRVMVDADEVGIALSKMVNLLLQPEHEMISLYYGADLAETEAQELTESLRRDLPNLEIVLYFGGQPHYHFIFSIE
ncbi:DAK2 domain-containing protein [Pelosinus sp. sgz500959]|uniref:DAK2 domain-containing protein n=1 Tax=Pelosinus sp. sgz500959 TaxID=3242472 RepID=UPI00366F3901